HASGLEAHPRFVLQHAQKNRLAMSPGRLSGSVEKPRVQSKSELTAPMPQNAEPLLEQETRRHRIQADQKPGDRRCFPLIRIDNGKPDEAHHIPQPLVAGLFCWLVESFQLREFPQAL